MPDDRVKPAWLHDPRDTRRYAVAVDSMCPADGSSLSSKDDASPTLYCDTCLRMFNREDGGGIAHRMDRTWWNPDIGPPDPSKDELRHLLVQMLMSASPHPVEHPTMWRAWGDTCRRLGLNPRDYRIPTSDKALARELEGDP